MYLQCHPNIQLHTLTIQGILSNIYNHVNGIQKVPVAHMKQDQLKDD
jgi:hypothetical protein